MALKVPTYEQKVDVTNHSLSSPVVYTRNLPKAIPAAFGTEVVEAESQLAKVGEKLAKHIQQMAMDEQDIQVVAKETLARQEIQSLLNNPETESIDGIERTKGLLGRQLGQAKGVTEEFDKYYYEQLQPKYLNGLSKYQQSKLQPNLDNYYNTTRQSIIQHEAREWDKNIENTVKSNLEQRKKDAVLIIDGKTLNKAIDESIDIASVANKKYDKSTRELKEQEIAESIAGASADSALTFEEADKLLLSVKDKTSKGWYQDKRNELFNKFAQEKKKNELAIVAAKNKREDEILSASILGGKDTVSGNPITVDFIKSELANGTIDPKFAKAMMQNINSVEKVGAATKSETFNKLSDFILNPGNEPEDIRLELLKENAKGKLNNEDFNILYTFNQQMKNNDKKLALLKGLNFWHTDYANNNPEVRAHMFKNYMQRIAKNEEPALAIDAVIKDEISILHPQAATYPKEGKKLMDISGAIKRILPTFEIRDEQETGDAD